MVKRLITKIREWRLEKKLISLIDRMTVEEGNVNSKDSVSWNAYREAEKLTNPDIYPLIKDIILNIPTSRGNKLNAVYFIMGKLLKNTPSAEYLNFYIHRLSVESDKYLIHSMLDLLACVQIPSDTDIRNIIDCTTNDKWLIRYSAINALGACNTNESRETLASFVCQTDEKKYRNEIIYANASLGRIGTVEDIPLLEQHIASRIRDIKSSAEFAIKQIQERWKICSNQS